LDWPTKADPATGAVKIPADIFKRTAVVAGINGRESTKLILNGVRALLEVELVVVKDRVGLAVFVMIYGFVRIEDRRRRRRGEDETNKW
jgi:hypothetical protein